MWKTIYGNKNDKRLYAHICMCLLITCGFCLLLYGNEYIITRVTHVVVDIGFILLHPLTVYTLPQAVVRLLIRNQC